MMTFFFINLILSVYALAYDKKTLGTMCSILCGYVISETINIV